MAGRGERREAGGELLIGGRVQYKVARLCRVHDKNNCCDKLLRGTLVHTSKQSGPPLPGAAGARPNWCTGTLVLYEQTFRG